MLINNNSKPFIWEASGNFNPDKEYKSRNYIAALRMNNQVFYAESLCVERDDVYRKIGLMEKSIANFLTLSGGSYYGKSPFDILQAYKENRLQWSVVWVKNNVLEAYDHRFLEGLCSSHVDVVRQQIERLQEEVEELANAL